MNITNVNTTTTVNVPRKGEKANAPVQSVHAIDPSNATPDSNGISNITNFTPHIPSQNPNHTFLRTNFTHTTDVISIPSPSASPTHSTSNLNHNHHTKHPILSLVTPSPTPPDAQPKPKSNHPSTIPALRINQASSATSRTKLTSQKALSHSPMHKPNTDVNINLRTSIDSIPNRLITKFGQPTTMAEFNIMKIADVLSQANHIHQNRELKDTVQRIKNQMSEKEKDITQLNEQVKVYKQEADKYERLLIEFNRIKKLNASLLSHNQTYKKENAKLKQVIKERNGLIHNLQNRNTIQCPSHDHGDDKELLEPLQIIEQDEKDNTCNAHILAPKQDNHNHTEHTATEQEVKEATDNNDNNDNNNNNTEEIRPPSQWLKNQRLIQLTGDQTYMTAHQKVIRDPDQKKSHKTYQRQDTLKSLQAENQSLKAQLIQTQQELQSEQNNHVSVSNDGKSAEYLKSQLAKVREEMEQEKQIVAKFKASMTSSDDLEQMKLNFADLQAEYDRLNIRYEGSKRRTERLQEEKEEMKTVSDQAVKERDELKEKTKAWSETTKEHIVKLSNEKEMHVKEAYRLTQQNKKLMKRESEEKELKVEMKKLSKKLTDAERQSSKWKKKYKDLKQGYDSTGHTKSKSKKKKRKKKRKKSQKSEMSASSDASGEDDKEVHMSKHREKHSSKRDKRREKQISEDLQSAIEQSKSIEDSNNHNHSHKAKEIGNHFKLNDAIQETNEDMNWLGGGNEDEMISKPLQTPLPMNEMDYGSASPQMLPIQDSNNNSNQVMGIKNEWSATHPVQNNNEMYQDNTHDSEDEFVDHDLMDVFQTNDTYITKAEDNMASILRDDPMEDEDDFDGISSGVLSGVLSPHQNPVSGLWKNNPFTVPTDPFNVNGAADGMKERPDEMVAAPLMLQEEDTRDESSIQPQNNADTMQSGGAESGGVKPQPLFVAFEGGTSDSSDADHSDHPVFQSPLQSEPQVFAPMRIEGDDALNIDGNTHLFNDDVTPVSNHQENETKENVKTENVVSFDMEVGLKTEPLHNNNQNDDNEEEDDDEDDDEDNAPIISIATNQNHKKRPRSAELRPSDMDITQPVTKKRKLNADANPNFDDFDSFMDEEDDTTLTTVHAMDHHIPTAPPPMTTTLITSPPTNHTNRNPPIKNENETAISVNPFQNHTTTASKPSVAIQPTANKTHNNNRKKKQHTTTNTQATVTEKSADRISTQFADWRAEFTHLITRHELQSSELRTRCIESIIYRWQHPQNVSDAKNKATDIARGIAEIMIGHRFNDLCTDSMDFFSSNNSATYLPLFGALSDIMCKLNEKKANLIAKLKNICRKLLSESQFGAKCYFVCGLMASLCKCGKDEGYFWRSIISMMSRFELHQCADLLSIMFECYPAQITSHREAFVMNCFKHIFTFHANFFLFSNMFEGNPQSQRVKQCYQRLMSVVNGRWEYIQNKRGDLDVIIKKELDKTIANPNNEDMRQDTVSGISLVCECNIRYAINDFLPRTLYPILYQQLQVNKPQLQVFLLDLYYQCVNRVYRRLKQCQEANCEWVRSDIQMIMENILVLAIGCGGSTDCVAAMVSLCCIRNLLCIQSNEYIENVICQNVHSDQRFIQFATNILQTWSVRMASFTNKEKKREQNQFNAFLNMTANVFKKKCYNPQVFMSLKRQYTTKQ